MFPHSLRSAWRGRCNSRSEEHTSELQSLRHLVCRLLLEKKTILRECPKERQTLLFSATMPDWVRRIGVRHMRDPVTIAISSRPEIPQVFFKVSATTELSPFSQPLSLPL